MKLTKIVLAAAAGSALALSSGVAVAKPAQAGVSSGKSSVRAGTKVVKSEKGTGTTVAVLFTLAAIGTGIAIGGGSSSP
jgi:hypothetical protein